VGAGALVLFHHAAEPPLVREPRDEAASTSKPHSSRSGSPSERSPRPAAASRALASEHADPEPSATSVTSRVVTAANPEPAGRLGGDHRVRVALVIDDLGYELDELKPLEALGVPVSYSVLPFADHTPEVAAELRRRKAEILLHLPMEPKNGQNPGPGALLRTMSDGELREKTEAALKAVPGAVGVNNHMGSLLSSEEGPMTAVLGVLAERGLFFLDSRTSAETVGYKVAIGLGIPAAERQVFLDDGEPGAEAVHVQFERLLAMARARGAAIAIGHPHPETLAALAREVPKAKAEGVEFVPVSFLLTRSGGE
jgi:polysaccharide deacetylase 2 family uncharacterized protein YibQ